MNEARKIEFEPSSISGSGGASDAKGSLQEAEEPSSALPSQDLEHELDDSNQEEEAQAEALGKDCSQARIAATGLFTANPTQRTQKVPKDSRWLSLVVLLQSETASRSD